MTEKKIYITGELKAVAGDEEGTFEGYASTFGNVDLTNDIIEKGAFKKSLKVREPKVLWQHDMTKPVGKLLEAREDAKGLYVKVRIAVKTDLGRNAYEFMRADIINTLSIGFRTKRAEFDEETRIRTIKELDLFEFSLVTIPANPEAVVTGVKDQKDLAETPREFEEFLRDSGYSRKAAKAITSHGIKGYQNVLRDAGMDNDTPEDALRDADEAKKLLSSISQTLKEANHARTKGTR